MLRIIDGKYTKYVVSYETSFTLFCFLYNMEFFMIFTRLRSMLPHAKLLVYQMQPTEDSGRHAA